MKKQIFILGLMLLSVTGCALTRTELNVNVPGIAAENQNGKQVYIRSITDKRGFENHPATADIPSLKTDVTKASEDLKSHAIGRKRNSYGQALGDYVLEKDITVQKIIYEATRNALQSLGYAVTDKKEDAKADAIIMDITIDKLWSWFAPGFWAIQIKSDITTTNQISSAEKPSKIIVVEAHKINDFQIASNSNWIETVEGAITAFTYRAAEEFKEIE